MADNDSDATNTRMEENQLVDSASECSKCSCLYSNKPDESKLLYTDLSKSAENGCTTCSIILEGIKRWLTRLAYSFEPLRLVIDPNHEGIPRAHVTVLFEWPTSFLTLEFYSAKGSQSFEPWNRIHASEIVEKQISKESKLEAAIEWLQDQIEICETQHPNCTEKGQMPKSLPTRLLDLHTGLPNPNIRLIYPDQTLTAPYITVSHRWGHNTFITTTNSTIGERQQGISMHSLPQTFQDAVVITRRLGIRYLWIDSLCIVQDDANDWEIEASKMAAVYSGSYLTIAATSSKDGNGGCFPEISLEELEIERDEKITYVRQLPRIIDPWRSHLEVSGGWNPLEVPLLSRGWVYQERILSPRMVHFHEREIFWECKASLQCQCGAKLSRYNSSDKSNSVRPELDMMDSQKIFETWKDIVENYSKLHLTNAQDKLPALSGIASLFAARLEGQGKEYLAGLWRAFLPHSLFWETNWNQRYVPNVPQEYQAPSWSWAAINVPVSMRSGSKHDDFNIKNIWCHIPGNNPLGRVVDGRLDIEGIYVESPTLENEGRTKHSISLRFPELNLHFSFHADDYESCLKMENGTVLPWTLIAAETRTIGLGAIVLKQSDTVQGAYTRVGFAECGQHITKFSESWRRDDPMRVFSII